MANAGLLDLPPELRNRIFAYALPTWFYIEYEVWDGKVRLHSTRDISGATAVRAQAPPLLHVNRQIRAEVAPVFYYKNFLSVTCNISQVEALADWLAMHVALTGSKPFGEALELNISGVRWSRINQVWPLVRLVRATGIRLDGLNFLTWFFRGGVRRRLARAFEDALTLGRRAREEAKTETATKEEFDEWVKAVKKTSYVKSKIKSAASFY